ncbi:hypothetical protein PsorP6_000400 [Peronosclerospora sorghi]|uniref:Uncharacterized protein n=1 Tax=Peronosclerospora sorghi TaxID=230839 RepID=A0ACC0WY42_9STRA|nr:hypothetical protein PsorP6_000400 [Peronosclerospora sorghi]
MRLPSSPRSSAVKSLKELAVFVNEHGKSVCISPEGTRSKDGLVSNRSDYMSCFISTLLLIAWPDDDSLVSAEYFVLGKSLVLCTALYGLAHVTAIFTWETMHARLTHAGTTVYDQVAILWTWGHLVQVTMAHDDTEFVDKVTAWVLAFLSMEPA